MGRGCETAGLYLSPGVDTVFTLQKTWHMKPAGISSYYGGRYSTLYICLYPAALSPTTKARQEEPLIIIPSHTYFIARLCTME